MLINFPFLPETEESVQKWIKNLKEHNVPDQEIEDMNLNVNYYIPDQLTEEDSGRKDNTGLYTGHLLNNYQGVSLEEGYYIEPLPDFVPVIVTENSIDEDATEEVYKFQSSPLYRSFGYVVSVEDFMMLIGDQLHESNRKFCVCFYLCDYHEDMFEKNGQLHCSDFAVLEMPEKLISFNIFELLDKDSFVLEQEKRLGFFSKMINTDLDTFKNLSDHYRNRDFMESLDL